MKDKKKAFPIIQEPMINGIECIDDGMDLRDYFAAKALQGLLSCPSCSFPTVPCNFASESYEYADAMMEARKK